MPVPTWGTRPGGEAGGGACKVAARPTDFAVGDFPLEEHFKLALGQRLSGLGENDEDPC